MTFIGKHKKSLLIGVSAFVIALVLEQVYENYFFQDQLGKNQIKESQSKLEMTNALKKIASGYGLVFAFKPDCTYCHRFAPIVKQFADQYGFNLQGLSKSDEVFEGMICHNNEAELLRVNPRLEFPVLYLVNSKTKEVLPIAKGYISFDDLMTNVKSVISYLKNEG